MRPYLLWLLALIFVAIGLTMVAVTERGLKWVIALGIDYAPFELSVAQIQGRLIGPITLQDIKLVTDEAQLSITQLQMDWRPSALFAGTVHVTELVAHDAHYRQQMKGKAEQAPVALPTLSLPLAVTLDHAAVHGLSIATPAQDRALLFTKLELSAHSEQGVIHIDEFTLHSDMLQASVQGQVEPTNEYPLALQMAWTLTPPGYQTVRGSGSISGDLQDLALNQQISAPVTVSLQGRIEKLVDSPKWNATLSTESMDIQRVRLDWPSIKITSALHTQGDKSGIDIQGQIKLSYQTYGLDSQIDARYADNRFQLNHLDLFIPSTNAELRTHGVISQLDGTPNFDLTGKWQRLAWPLDTTASLISDSGQFHVRGNMDNYLAVVEANLEGPDIPPAQLQLHGTGTKEGLVIENGEAALLDGEVKAQGVLNWHPHLSWQFDISGQDLNPARQWSPWPGSIALEAHTQGHLVNGQPVGNITIRQLHGQLRELPLAAQLELRLSPQGFGQSHLELTSGGARLYVAGQLQEDWDLAWELHAPRLAELLPTGEGELWSQGTLAGPLRTPIVTATLDGKGLRYEQYQLDDIHLVGHIDLSDSGPSVVDLSAQGLRVDDRQVTSLSISVKGQASAHQLSASAVGPRERIDMEISGAYQQERWQGQLGRADIDSQALGPWQLTEQGELVVSKRQRQIGPWCWTQNDSRICGQLDWSMANGWHGEVKAIALPLAPLRGLTPENITLSGTADAQFSGAWPPKDDPTGTGRIHFNNARIEYGLEKEQIIAWETTLAQLDARLDTTSFFSQLTLALADGGSISGQLTLPPQILPAIIAGEALPAGGNIDGHLHATLLELGMLSTLLPQLEAVQGSARLDLLLSGPMDEPRVSGEFELEQFTAAIPQLGLQLHQGGLQAHSDGRLVTVNAQARSGDGHLQLSGNIQRSEDGNWSTALGLQGDSFEVINLPELEILASPDLSLQVQGRRIDLMGELLIPQARIEPRDLTTVVSPSQDVVIVDQMLPIQAEHAKWDFHSIVRLRLGEQIDVDAFGLSGKVSGTMVIIEEPSQLTKAFGELRIDEGQYQAYGQKLTIERGRLLFVGGPLDNPGVDARASRKIADVVAGINIRGPIRSPQVTVFSLPAMAETDALSYLILGRPMNQASSSEGQQLFQAASSVGLAGGELLARQIGQAFGIEEVRIESGPEPEQAELIVGQYLSPKLYVSYGMSLFEQVNTWRLRYHLSRRWTAEAETGLQSGADLLFTLEREPD